MRIALSSRMDSDSGNTTEKLVALNTIQFSYRPKQLVNEDSGASTEILGNILELPKW